MASTYVTCPACGQRALNVATRCPRCAAPFDRSAAPLPAPGPSHRRSGSLVAALAILGVVVLLLVVLARSPRQTARPAPGTPEDSGPAAAAVPSAGAAPVAALAADSLVTPRTPGPTLRRFARTWVNVRSRRASGAPTVRILSPGDSLLVDSLRWGWYRVLVDGHPLGYASRLYLDSLPPTRRP
jgi:hypothetical protein